MNYDSYTDMAPHRLVAWCSQRGLEDYLPFEFQSEDILDEGTQSQAAGQA